MIQMDRSMSWKMEWWGSLTLNGKEEEKRAVEEITETVTITLTFIL